MAFLSGLVRPAAAFAVNGALYGTLLTRYPEIADRVEASETAFGVVLFAAAIGGLLGSVLAPLLVRWSGEARATVIVGSGYAVLAVVVAWAPSLAVLGLALLVLGLADGAHDVGMNALSVRAQQALGTPVMGRAHATWSLSLTGAGVLGVGAAAADVPVVGHVSVIALAALILQLAVLPNGRRPIPAAGPRANPTNGSEPTGGSAPENPGPGMRLSHLRWLLLALGMAALAASYVESPGQEWTGLLLSRGLDASAGLAAAGPVVFSAGLVISRLVLDTVTRRAGAAAVATVAGATIALSMFAGLLVAATGGSAWFVLAAIALAGLGAGPVFPLLFGAGDQLSVRRGIAPATTASIVSTLSRIGAISAPVVVGPLSEAVGLPMVLAVMAVGGAMLAFILPRAIR